MAPPSHRRKIECMTFKESLRIFNYGASFTTRLLNDIDMDMLVLDDWESRLAFFSTEAVGEMTLASELIVEGRGLEYDPQGDIRALRGGWQRVIRGGRDLGWRKKTRRRNIRRGGDVGWWKVPRPKGWVGIRRGQGEIREAVRRMEAALVGEKSD